MPIPPMMRAAMNTSTFQAKAHPIAETMYSTPIQSSVARGDRTGRRASRR
jgi:hypothetical protein